MRLVLAVLVLMGMMVFSTPAFSHGGRTNSMGCHNNRATGTRHCHNSSNVRSRPSRHRTTPSTPAPSSPEFLLTLQSEIDSLKDQNKELASQIHSLERRQWRLTTTEGYNPERARIAFWGSLGAGLLSGALVSATSQNGFPLLMGVSMGTAASIPNVIGHGFDQTEMKVLGTLMALGAMIVPIIVYAD